MMTQWSRGKGIRRTIGADYARPLDQPDDDPRGRLPSNTHGLEGRGHDSVLQRLSGGKVERLSQACADYESQID